MQNKDWVSNGQHFSIFTYRSLSQLLDDILQVGPGLLLIVTDHHSVNRVLERTLGVAGAHARITSHSVSLLLVSSFPLEIVRALHLI